MKDPANTSIEAPGNHDGVKPMQACCLSCGYQFGGAAIREGMLVCSECGKKSYFAFKPVRRKHLFWLAVFRVSLWLLIALALCGWSIWKLVVQPMMNKHP